MESFLNAASDAGLGSPASRAISLGAIAFAAQVAIKPSASYKKEGNEYKARPFKLLSKDPNASWTPWWSWPVAGVVTGGLFL